LAYRKKTPTDPNNIHKSVLKAKQKGMIYREHAKKRMVEKNITQKEIDLVIEHGAVVEEQEHPNPPKIRYQIMGPSQLPYVVVVAITKGGRLDVITAFKA